jgi:hypothetical protein
MLGKEAIVLLKDGKTAMDTLADFDSFQNLTLIDFRLVSLSNPIHMKPHKCNLSSSEAIRSSPHIPNKIAKNNEFTSKT